MKLSIIERKIKALEDYLGVVLELDPDDKNPYDEYHNKEYGLGSDVKKIKEKVLDKKKTPFFG